MLWQKVAAKAPFCQKKGNKMNKDNLPERNDNLENTKNQEVREVKQPYPEVIIKDGWIYKEVTINDEKGRSKKSWIKVNVAPTLEKIIKNIDTSELKFEISVKYKEQENKFTMLRQHLVKKSILEYQRYGLPVIEPTALDYIKSILNQEDLLPINFEHQKLGWSKDEEGNQIFLGEKGVGIDSKYCGSIRLSSRGTVKGWKKIVKKHILGRVYLEFGVVVGFSSVLHGLLGEEVGLDCILIHLYDDSSIGKTTMARIVISPFSYPDYKDNSLFGTWNSTPNAIYANLKNNFGLPGVLDEVSMAQWKDFTNFTYCLASGRDKARLDKNADLKQTAFWTTSILSTGESSLISKCNNNSGIKVRVFEITNVPWTESAEQADRIKDRFLKNHGKAGYTFVKKVLALGKKDVLERWKKCKEVILNKLPSQDHFSKRRSCNLQHC